MQEQRRVSLREGTALAVIALATALPAQAGITQVPEPGSLALVGAGFAAAILVARIWKKK